MAEVRGKTNKKFMVLSAIGIFMVVDHHTFTALNLFGDYIPYNSFFMPMFVFISGYFNKVGTETKLLPYIGKKAKTLLLPYAGISILVFVIQQLINLIKTGGIVPLPSGYLMYVLERVITSGSPFPLVTPMWFVISLFFTLLFYALLKKLLNKIWNNFVMFGIFSILHFLSVFLAQNIGEESLHPFLLPLKVLFLLPFLELGIIYKKYLEEKLTRLSGGWKIGLLFLLLLLNVIRTSYLPNAYDVAFDSIDELAGFTSPFFVTPMLSSVIGILFWLTLTDLIAKPLYESRFVNFMSCNTFWIMGLHILFFNIFNCVLLLIDKIMELPYFDAEAFRESEWYFWEISPNIKLAYLVIGILGPLGLKWICDRIKKSLSNKKANVTNV
ncbi:MAG: acyltransferase [Clostridiales bacterium]|nr:acyltransferase [Clostridiales bacterium]